MVGLVHEYRGGVLENVHPGRICVVDDTGRVIYTAGDAGVMTYFRSASKPLQVLPVIVHGLDKKYGLSEKELTILAASHSGEPMHMEALTSLLEKTGFTEDDLIMLPTYPDNTKARHDALRDSLPPRKLFHNCSGKHIGAMMLEEFLTGSHLDYWKPGSAAQKEITEAISYMTSTPVDDIATGVDGCGVPVFAVPQKNIALAFMRLACPDKIAAPEMRAAAEKIVYHMNRNPLMIEGTGSLCSQFNQDKNVIAKGGAQGVYAFGLKKERLGIAIKNEDGDEASWPITIAEILRQLNYDNPETIAMLDKLAPITVINDNQTEVGVKRPVFRLEPAV